MVRVSGKSLYSGRPPPCQFGRDHCAVAAAGGPWVLVGCGSVTLFSMLEGEKSEYLLLRVGACADDFRLMGGERGSDLAGVAVAVEASASSTRKASSACAPPAMERMWRGPFGVGANCTVQSVVRCGRRRARRCARSRRFAVTKDYSEIERT
jgi:hypothetical protein